ncbi:MAG: glucose-6-phosphate isomerase [Pseudomonadota bacterium]
MDTYLQAQAKRLKASSLTHLFEQSPQRCETFSLEAGEIFYDYSRNHIDSEAMSHLCQFAERQGLRQAITDLFNGESVNNTEQRPALHSALREPKSASEKSRQVHAALDKMKDFVEQIHRQQWRGFTGKPVDSIVNIGIGGSDLGPRMVTQALSAYRVDTIDVFFVANIDGADLEDTLSQLNPETTVFILASKSFTTLETLNNALSARQWCLDGGCSQDALYKHFIAISTNLSAAKDFGIAADNIFPLWDWVGGRYSLWSAIGLPIALAVGMDNFHSLLQGAYAMDIHFRDAAFADNMPVIAALLSHWYCHYWGTRSHAVLPYAQRLCRLPAYLQQLDMESLGKCVTRDGLPINQETGVVIWGTEGTNGQHSFHQLLHQGTQMIPVDFIAVKQSMSDYSDQHRHLLACCIGQSQALLQGKTLKQAQMELRAQGLDEAEIKRLAPHKVIAGNKPSSTIVLNALTPKSLGALIAFYEHKVYASSVLLGINAFDQWGVELGKQLGKPVYHALQSGECDPLWDSSTRALINALKTS